MTVCIGASGWCGRSTVHLVWCGGGSPAVPCTVSAALLLGEGPTPLLALQV